MRWGVASGIVLSGLLYAGSSGAQTVSAGYSSAWWSQIGLTSGIETTSNGGAGVMIGIVDTGVVATNAELKGRVSTLSSCPSTSISCGAGYTDQNGHGTAVAAIAAGNMVNGGWMTGVAGKATIVAEKVLDASGSGYGSDVAKGIISAAKAGAKIINLSLTYIPTGEIVSAINTATASGSIIVFAGGNAAALLNGGANTSGLTAAALSRLVFAGSVGPTNGLSYFSNIPGSGSVVVGSTKTAYSNLWLMAPGQNIVAPGISYGSNAYAYWSGTSMAAPIISGALALLEATWPILYKNGTATSLLFKTATDLGSKGADGIFGQGLLNLTTAFQPSGTLSVSGSGGKTYSVSSLSTSLLTGGALGSLSSISSQLTKFTALDTFQRNFTVDLSGLVAKKPTTAAQAASTAVAPVVTASAFQLTDGSTLRLTAASNDLVTRSSLGLSTDSIGKPEGGRSSSTPLWQMELTDSKGDTTIAMGQGFPVTASFSDALWGPGSNAALAANGMGVSNALLGFAEGGAFGAWGSSFGKSSRLALSWTHTPTDLSPIGATAWQATDAQAVGVGFTTKLASDWTGGFTLGGLSETSGLLGSSYNGNGPLSMGNQHHSASVGFATSYVIDDDTTVLADMTLARSDGATTNSLIQSVSSLMSRAYGLGLVERNAFQQNDSFSIFLRKPMRVVSGSATLALNGADQDGNLTINPIKASLVPDGSETNLVMGYTFPMGRGMSLNGSATLSQDAENIKGLWSTGAVAHFKVEF